MNQAASPKPLEQPLTVEQIKAGRDKAGFMTVVIAVALYDLIDNDLEEFNDLAEDKICPGGWALSDIAYSVAGHIPPASVEDDGQVLVEVTAELYAFDEEDR